MIVPCPFLLGLNLPSKQVQKTKSSMVFQAKQFGWWMLFGWTLSCFKPTESLPLYPIPALLGPKAANKSLAGYDQSFNRGAFSKSPQSILGSRKRRRESISAQVRRAIDDNASQERLKHRMRTRLNEATERTLPTLVR
jgi:hypothetical protein